MLFHLFCMFYNYWRIKYRSQISAGKRTVKIPYLRRSVLPGKHQRVPISPEDGGRQKESLRGATPPPGAGQPWAVPGHGEAALAHLCRCLFAYFILPRTLSLGEGRENYSAAAARRKTTEREKLSGRQKSAGEIPSRREEIVAIVTVIEQIGRAHV